MTRELRDLACGWLPVLSIQLRADLSLAIPHHNDVIVVWPDEPQTVPPATRLLLAVCAIPDDPIQAKGYVIDTNTVAVAVRSPHGEVTAALTAVLPPSRRPGAVVAGLQSAARLFGATLALQAC
jgi:hypothetical protein